jgi:hypothetical protein
MGSVNLARVEVGGSPFHGRGFAERLGFTYNPEAPRTPWRYFVSSFHRKNVARFMEMNGGGRVRVVHWIGTDVEMALGGDDCIYPGTTHHWAVTPQLAAELATIGIDAEVRCYPPRVRWPEPLPPGGDSILTYVPASRLDYFYKDVLDEVERRTNRRFVKLPIHNIRAPGGIDTRIDDVFRECSHYVRLVKHDGFSGLAAEMIMAGRVVITNQDRPYQVRVEPTVDDVLAHLDDAPDPAAPAHYYQLTDPEHIRAAWRKLIETAG